MFETKVKVGDSYVTARVALATAEDIEYISQLNAEREEEVGSDTADILEYAHFAVTKWEYYRTANRCPDDWGAVGPLLFEDWSREIGGLFVLKCDDVPELPVMAFAFVRRTWANHITVDFLARDPRVAAFEPKIKGAGRGLLLGLCQVADRLAAPIFWGEATSSSVGFYAGEFTRRRICDLFAVSRSRYSAYLTRYKIKSA